MPNLERLQLSLTGVLDDTGAIYLDLNGVEEILTCITNQGNFVRVGCEKGYQITNSGLVREINTPQH